MDAPLKQVFSFRKESITTTLIELYMPLRSVSLIWESFICDLGFNSQTLNGCLQLF